MRLLINACKAYDWEEFMNYMSGAKYGEENCNYTLSLVEVQSIDYAGNLLSFSFAISNQIIVGLCQIDANQAERLLTNLLSTGYYDARGMKEIEVYNRNAVFLLQPQDNPMF